MDTRSAEKVAIQPGSSPCPSVWPCSRTRPDVALAPGLIAGRHRDRWLGAIAALRRSDTDR